MKKRLIRVREEDAAALAILGREIWEEHYTSILGPEQVAYMVTVEDHTAAGEFSAEQTAYVICRPFLRERPIFLARPRRTDFHRRGVIL